jgi:hypothetical protein
MNSKFITVVALVAAFAMPAVAGPHVAVTHSTHGALAHSTHGATISHSGAALTKTH